MRSNSSGTTTGHRAGGAGRRCGEGDFPAWMRLLGSDFVAGSLDVAKDALRALEQFLAAFGQPHAAVGAGEYGDVERLREPLHGPRESRLGDMQMTRSAGDTAELGDADEIVKAAQFHRAAI